MGIFASKTLGLGKGGMLGFTKWESRGIVGQSEPYQSTQAGKHNNPEKNIFAAFPI